MKQRNFLEKNTDFQTNSKRTININSSIFTKYLNQLFTTLPKKFTSEFLQYYEEVLSVSQKLFQKAEKRGIFPRQSMRLTYHEYLNLTTTV